MSDGRIEQLKITTTYERKLLSRLSPAEMGVLHDLRIGMLEQGGRLSERELYALWGKVKGRRNLPRVVARSLEVLTDIHAIILVEREGEEVFYSHPATTESLRRAARQSATNSRSAQLPRKTSSVTRGDTLDEWLIKHHSSRKPILRGDESTYLLPDEWHSYALESFGGEDEATVRQRSRVFIRKAFSRDTPVGKRFFHDWFDEFKNYCDSGRRIKDEHATLVRGASGGFGVSADGDRGTSQDNIASAVSSLTGGEPSVSQGNERG